MVEKQGILGAPSVLTGTESNWYEDGFANVDYTGAAKLNIWSTSTNDWLISPSINLGSGATNYQLEFDLALTAYGSVNVAASSGIDDKFAVLISTNNGNTWTSVNTLKFWDNAGSPNVYNNISTVGERIIIDLSSYTGVVKFAFYGESTVSNADNEIFIDNVAVKVIPNCPPPTSLAATNITSNSASLTWTEFSSATQWDIQYGVSGFSLGSGTTIPNVNSTTYSLTGLNSSTTYQFYVRAKCSVSEYSTWTGPFSFTTGCTSITVLPWIENFETISVPNLPNCWFKENGDWVSVQIPSDTYDAGPYSGTKFLRNTYSATNEYVWTPGFNLTNGQTYEFSFYWAGDNYSGWTGDVFVNTDQNSTGAQQLGGAFVSSTVVTTKNYTKVTQTYTPTVSGTYYFAVRINATYSPWYISFDDFEVKVAAPCQSPTNLVVADIFSALISWTAPPTPPTSGYDLYYSTSMASPTIPSPGYVAITGTTQSISGLIAETTYYVWVRSHCSGSDFSSWVGPVSFVMPDLSCVNSLSLQLPTRLQYSKTESTILMFAITQTLY